MLPIGKGQTTLFVQQSDKVLDVAIDKSKKGVMKFQIEIVQ
jgi:hypothetical protein